MTGDEMCEQMADDLNAMSWRLRRMMIDHHAADLLESVGARLRWIAAPHPKPFDRPPLAGEEALR